MKKGIYYLPLFIMLLVCSIWSVLMENTFTTIGWIIATLMLCEVYYLRFLK